MKNFIFGFLSAYFIFTVAVFIKSSYSATTQSQTSYETPRQVQQDMDTLFKDKQDKNFFVGSSTPAITSFGQGDILFSTSSLKGWTRYQNDVYFFVLNKF